jgi:hypothetical protein
MIGVTSAMILLRRFVQKRCQRQLDGDSLLDFADGVARLHSGHARLHRLPVHPCLLHQFLSFRPHLGIHRCETGVDVLAVGGTLAPEVAQLLVVGADAHQRLVHRVQTVEDHLRLVLYFLAAHSHPLP